ncbi:DUF192 domain-containing protein [Candidatus Gracilibacteria bacterium]|nr:DUF192 domain-containing protein [Candidatus Gracilibacteria bacterium]
MIFLVFFILFFETWFGGIGSAGLQTNLLAHPSAQILMSEIQVALKDPQYIFQVEIARTDAELEKGLMYRTSMPANHGMLFVFKDDAARTFWMKNTLIPLDMIFVDYQGNVVSILPNVPPCELPENQSRNCPTYPSQKPSRYVLELNAGVSQQLGLHDGDKLFLPKEILGSPSRVLIWGRYDTENHQTLLW